MSDEAVEHAKTRLLMLSLSVQSRRMHPETSSACGAANVLLCTAEAHPVVKGVDGRDGHAAAGQGAGLVEDHGGHLAGALQHIAALHQHPELRGNACAHLNARRNPRPSWANDSR